MCVSPSDCSRPTWGVGSSCVTASGGRATCAGDPPPPAPQGGEWQPWRAPAATGRGVGVPTVAVLRARYLPTCGLGCRPTAPLPGTVNLGDTEPSLWHRPG